MASIQISGFLVRNIWLWDSKHRLIWNSKQAVQKSFQKHGPVSSELLTFRKEKTVYLLFGLMAKTNKLQSYAIRY